MLSIGFGLITVKTVAPWEGILRVFLSSTVYDLIDVRAELGCQLREIGITPVLSDDKLSDFRIQPDANSIETCLTNVASCDEIVVILDRRYGPRLGDFGFDNVSATHLEYRRAIECRLPIHFFVRDRLDADYAVWKRNGRSDAIAFAWVANKDMGLFELIDEHSMLTDDKKSNWYFTFSSSVDLKDATSRYFRSRILPTRLIEAIQNNTFPMFDIQTECNQEIVGRAPTLKFTNQLTNVGGAPAFNYRIRWEHRSEEPQKKLIVAPGQSILMTALFNYSAGHNHAELFMVADYESPLGIAVQDRYKIHGLVQNMTLVSGGTLLSRTYKRTSEITLEIEDA